LLAPKTGLVYQDIAIAIAYVLLGRLVLQGRWSAARSVIFAALNIIAMYLLFFWGRDERFTAVFNLLFAAYIGFVSLQYLVLRFSGSFSQRTAWLAFWMPIGFLVFVRYAPVLYFAHRLNESIYAVLVRHPEFTLNLVFVGCSYLAFRTSYLVLEVRNGTVPRPSYPDYLTFAFFVPTLSVGPISRYSEHRLAFVADKKPEIPFATALLRVLVGAVKFRFLSPLLNQLTYSGLLLDGHPHPWIDLPIAGLAYYLYLYCNFSGFCDIAVGGAGLIGISVSENFSNPFAARNVADFWNRWHITLSQYMRDVVFSPLSRFLIRSTGPKFAMHAIAVAITIVFLLVGVWHGVGWNYAAFGAVHALGVAVNHYYTIFLKKSLGAKGYAAYEQNAVVRALAITLTFAFVTVSLFFFANDGQAMRQIFSSLRFH